MTNHGGNHTGKTSGMGELRDGNRAMSAHAEDNIMGTHDARAMPVGRTRDNIQGARDARAMAVVRTGDNILGTSDPHTMSVAHTQDKYPGCL